MRRRNSATTCSESYSMDHMHVIEADDPHAAQRSFIDHLHQSGVALRPTMALYVETIHREAHVPNAWLCYVASSVPEAA